MAKNDDAIEMTGVVLEVLPDMKFRIKLSTGNLIMGYLSGKMRTNNIRVLMGDKVKVELTPYDLTKCRVTYREKQ